MLTGNQLSTDELVEYMRNTRRTTQDHFLLTHSNPHTGMLHFDGRDAAEVVALYMGTPPPPAAIDPKAPYGSMAVNHDIFNAKGRVLDGRGIRIIDTTSMAQFKAAQVELDKTRDQDLADRDDIMASLPIHDDRLGRHRPLSIDDLAKSMAGSGEPDKSR